MTPETTVEILRTAFMTAFWLSLPLLASGFIVGIVVSLVQIMTSIQDPAFGSVPRLVALLVTLIALMPWMLNKAMFYTVTLFSNFGLYAR